MSAQAQPFEHNLLITLRRTKHSTLAVDEMCLLLLFVISSNSILCLVSMRGHVRIYGQEHLLVDLDKKRTRMRGEEKLQVPLPNQ
jgi:hypothetical protein